MPVPKTYWTKVLYTAFGNAAKSASDYVTRHFNSITLHPMKRILFILNLSILAITARGSLVLVSGTGGNTYDPNAAYGVSGSFGGSVPIAEVGGQFTALA